MSEKNTTQKRQGATIIPISEAEIPGSHLAVFLATKGDVARAVKVSQRTIETWVKQRKIPVVRLGKRCVRFHLASVLSALRKFQINEVK
jgi:excisionase family DNA binding protein